LRQSTIPKRQKKKKSQAQENLQQPHNSSSPYLVPRPGFKPSLVPDEPMQAACTLQQGGQQRTKAHRTQFTTISGSRCCCTLHKHCLNKCSNKNGFASHLVHLHNTHSSLYPSTTRNVARAVKILTVFSADYLKPSIGELGGSQIGFEDLNMQELVVGLQSDGIAITKSSFSSSAP